MASWGRIWLLMGCVLLLGCSTTIKLAKPTSGLSKSGEAAKKAIEDKQVAEAMKLLEGDAKIARKAENDAAARAILKLWLGYTAGEISDADRRNVVHEALLTVTGYRFTVADGVLQMKRKAEPTRLAADDDTDRGRRLWLDFHLSWLAAMFYWLDGQPMAARAMWAGVRDRWDLKPLDDLAWNKNQSHLMALLGDWDAALAAIERTVALGAETNALDVPGFLQSMATEPLQPTSGSALIGNTQLGGLPYWWFWFNKADEPLFAPLFQNEKFFSLVWQSFNRHFGDNFELPSHQLFLKFSGMHGDLEAMNTNPNFNKDKRVIALVRIKELEYEPDKDWTSAVLEEIEASTRWVKTGTEIRYKKQTTEHTITTNDKEVTHYQGYQYAGTTYVPGSKTSYTQTDYIPETHDTGYTEKVRAPTGQYILAGFKGFNKDLKQGQILLVTGINAGGEPYNNRYAPRFSGMAWWWLE